MSFRRWYYNRFSSSYDWFLRVHSRDRGEAMRTFLADTAASTPYPHERPQSA